MCSDSALVTAAALLRRLHDATAPFAAELPGGWMLPDRAPAEVICHGDFTPYNCVFDGEQVVGVIDFDAAHPGPRLWDIAYAVYRFAPLTAPTNPDGFGTVAEQAARARQFCDSYGLIDRGGLLATAGQRLIALIAFIRTEAAAGNAAFARHLAEGHDLAYQRDIDYLDEHRAELDRLLA